VRDSSSTRVVIPIPSPLGDAVAPSQSPARTVAMVTEVCRSLWAGAVVISGATMAVPEFEAKLGLGFHLFLVTDLARDLEYRLDELGASGQRGRVDARRRPQLRSFDGETDPARLFWLAYRCFLERAVQDSRAILNDDGALADAPTRHIVRQHLRALVEALEWGGNVLERYLEARSDEERTGFDRWVADRDHDQVDRQAGRRRPREARRDDRFSTFAHTRMYRTHSETSALAPTDEYEADLLELVRVNRDEIDAIETFCLVYFDLLDDAPLDMLYDLARTAWDEARHALLGQRLLEHLGHDPFTFPCSMIGIMVRSMLGGWDALAQISLFGELNIISPMRSLATRARWRGEGVIADSFEFICSDEAQHLKRIRRWLKSHHPLGDLDTITSHTQRRAGQELERAGVLNEEYFVGLTKAQVFKLLGE